MAQVIVLDRSETMRAILGDGPSACPLLEDTYKETLENAAITYDFTVPADHPDAQLIEPEGFVILKDLDGLLQQLRIKIVEDDVDEEGRRTRRVSCENAALELNGAIVRPQTWTGVTASQALQNALSGTRWQPGVVEWAGSRTIVIDGYKSVTEVLHQIASEFGLEIRWRVEWQDGRIVARYVDLLQRRGRVTGKRFEYRQDIRGLKRVEDTTELVTAMIGLGKSDDKGQRLTFAGVEWSRSKGDPVDKPLGQDWVGDPDALERWGLPGGRHLFGVFEDSEEDNPEELLQKTWDALQQRIQGRFTYEVEVTVLEHLAGLEHEAVRLGDTVTIHDTSVDPPMALEARVIEIERSYTDPSRDKVTLGQYRQLVITLPKVVAELQKRLNAKQGEWDAKQAPIYQRPTPPENPKEGTFWLDTSQTPNVLYRWSNGQWVKATPTEAGEVGAEKAITKGTNPPPNPSVGDLWIDTSQTPNILYVWNGSTWVKVTPTSPEDVGAEPRIARGSTPPSNPAVNAIWIDTSVNPPVWRRWTGSAWEKMTRTDFAELYGQITGEQIAPDSITPTHIAWLDASLITTGTMLFNRVRGGTAELGGSGNGNGLLIVRDANNTERVRVDNRGIVVNEASIRIKDNFTGVESHIRPSANMLLDHSFELVQWTGYENPDFTFPVADPGVWFVSSIGNARIATGDPFDTWPRIGLHGVQAAVVRHTSTVFWYQNTSLDKTVGRAGPYTASAYFAAYEATTQNTTAKIELWALDRYGNRISGTGVMGYASINANEKYVWKRAKVTISNLPSNAEYLQVVVGLSGADTYVLCDAVQLVPLDNPAIYEPEGNLWSFIRGNIVAPHLLAKNQEVENFSATKGFQFPSISNPGGNAKPSVYPMGLSWHLVSADSSWPSSYGTALTFRLSGSRGFQFFFSNGSPPTSYIRSITPINSDYNNWGSWKEI